MQDGKTEHRKEHSRVAAYQDDQVEQFAKQHGLTKEKTIRLIEKHGNDRAILSAAAEKLRTQ